MSNKKETVNQEKINEINKNTKQAKKDMLLDLGPYIVILVCIIVLRLFIATPVMVNGSSMNPTLKNGDIMIEYKLTKRFRGIKRFDIIVIDAKGGDLVKRVIGLPGDKIKYVVEEKPDTTKETKLYINGKEVKEDFLDINYRVHTCNNNATVDICEKEVKLGKDEYYVLGDNRINSKDSRYIGPINIKEIKGTAKLRIWPLTKFGNVK